MHIKGFIRCSLFVCMLSSLSLSAETWKLFFYMDASDNLADMAFKNVMDMVRGKPNEHVDLVMQLHVYGSNALRCRVTNLGLSFIEEVTVSGNCKDDFINAASWALSHNTADHTMLIFSNHGWGALDPSWNPETKVWEVAEMSLSNSTAATCLLPSKSKKVDQELQELHKQHRGFMFNSEHTYLNNHALVEGLAYVQNNLLQGGKIDIIAFDTCMGSMLEIATCVAPYARYLVGVQSCALLDGFDYQGFVAALNKGASPRLTSAEFIDVFDAYYAQHDTAGIYTCAALDLECINMVNETLDTVVAQLLNHPEYSSLLRQVRDESPRFCLWPMYSDPVGFCKLIEAHGAALSAQNERDSVVPAMHDFYTAVEQMVVARCGGTTTEGEAYGFSIYLPSGAIDSSYLTSLFAQSSQWINLLKRICDV
jgi:cysteine peptidase C11 family protein